MPLYEFECKKCHKEFEELLSSSSTEMPICPTCNSVEVQKKVSAGAIRAGSMLGGASLPSAPSCSSSSG